MTVALGDGMGSPRSLFAALAGAAAKVGRVRLILGWMPMPHPALDLSAFTEVCTIVPGWGLRSGAVGRVRFAPVRLSGVPALLHGPWRPDLLVTSVVPLDGGGYAFGSEVSWQRAAVGTGARVAAVASFRAPRADAGEPLDAGQVTIVDTTGKPPSRFRDSPQRPEHMEIARRVALLIPAHARLQVSQGPITDALLRTLAVPVRIDSGMLPDAVVDLAERGLLDGEPVATYLAGGERLYHWADGKSILRPIEYTHHPGRLSAEPLFAVNTAIEVDLDGQVAVEGTHDEVIGSHSDHAAAAARSPGGLSVIVMTARRGGKSTLVPQLSRPASMPSHDVDVVVNERGTADLRGLSRPDRRAALGRLWDSRYE
jgi:acyl-CoA hydrolase